MVITGILMASVTIFGCKAIVWLNRLAIPGLVVLLAWLTYRIVTVYSDKLDSSQATGDISFFAGRHQSASGRDGSPYSGCGLWPVCQVGEGGSRGSAQRNSLLRDHRVVGGSFGCCSRNLGPRSERALVRSSPKESSSSVPKKSRRPSLRSSYSEISRSRSSIYVRSVSITAEATWSRPAERRTDESSF
jgi:hypothetical protein